MVDVKLIAAPSSTKNADTQRDPSMTQTKEGNQWHFGMKAYFGVDAKSSLIQAVGCMTAKVAHVTMTEASLHGVEEIAMGDRGYKKANRTLSAVRSIIENPFRVVKKQLCFVNVRYRGLAKDTEQIVMLFAQAYLRLARKRMLPLLGKVFP